MVVVDDYENESLNLPAVSGHAESLAATLRRLGFTQDHRTGTTTAAEVQGWLARWRPTSRRLLLYWTGHAQTDGGDIALYCGDYDPANPFSKVSGSQLGDLLAHREAVDIVVIIDACKAGVGVDTVAAAFKARVQEKAYPVGREPGLAVFSSARKGEWAREGVFATALQHILTEGPPASTQFTWWTPHDELITPEELYDALRVHLHDTNATHQPDFGQARSVRGFFPFFRNPHHSSRRPDAVVETLRHPAFTESDLLEHFLIKFRGIDTLNAHGWYYAPRPQPQQHITDWLRDGTGILVVTGPPGSGKSALLGWLAAMSVPQYRRHATPTADTAELPPQNSVDAGIHAKQHTLQECVTILADTLEIPSPAEEWTEPAPLVEAVAALAAHKHRTITILLDALDEAYGADQTRIAVDLLAALANQPGIRVIVGTRPNRDDHAPPAGTDTSTPDRTWSAQGPLLRALTSTVASAQVIGLDTDPGSTTAITIYLTQRLLDKTTSSPYLGNPDLAETVARAVAEHSDGIFLFARLLARALIKRESPVDPTAPDTLTLFNGGVAEAFVADLAGYGPDRDRVRDLLRPLAWAEGSGLPRRQIWLTLANALRPTGIIEYTDQDIAWVLEHAGAHIIESGEDGQTVYRLYHQAFNDYFHTTSDNTTVQLAITHALLHLVEHP